MKSKGRMSSRMLGEFWVISELTGELGDVTMTAVQTIGYDVARVEMEPNAVAQPS